jgi:hypothetical protein
MSEYALILAAVAALGFIAYRHAALHVIGVVIGRSGAPGVEQELIGFPRTQDDCKNGGWQTFGFKDEAQCIAYVNGN